MSSSGITNPYAAKRAAVRVKDSPARPPDINGPDNAASEADAAATAGPAASNGAPSVSSTAAALVISATDKAGMEGIDRARIDAIILRESGDSLFMRQQRRRDQKVNERIQRLQQKLAEEEKSNPDWRFKMEREIDREIPKIIERRRKRSTCVVVDMDMFYMACELLSRPDLNDRPACVGGNMITTSNYVARKYGVRSAMAGWIGDKLVEELSGGKERLIHVPLNFKLYTAKSMEVRAILSEYDPSLRAYSLDEVYMDISSYLTCKLTKGWDHERIRDALALEHSTQEEAEQDAVDSEDEESEKTIHGEEQILQFSDSACQQAIAEILGDMRERVTQATGGLTCSAGAAPNFMLAKIASDRNKPNGQCIVGSNHDDITAFLYPLPPRKIGGIGRVTDKILNAFSITTVAKLHEQRALVRLLFQPASASHLLHASIGCSTSDEKSSDEDEGPSQKGISRERTFQAGKSWEDVCARLEDIGRLLSDDMIRKGFWARNIGVKVKLHTFDCLSRCRTLPAGVYLQDGKDIVKHAHELLSEMRKKFKGKQFSVRLLGIRCSAICSDEEKRSSMQGKCLESFFHEYPQSFTGTHHNATTSPIGSKQLIQPTTERSHRGGSNQTSMASYLHRQSSGDGEGDTPRISLDSSEQRLVYCPLCQKSFPEGDNGALNRHIDSCLNRSVVRETVSEAGEAPVPKRKKTCLRDFFAGIK